MARKSSFSPALKYPGIRDDLLRIFHQILETSKQDWENPESLPQTDTNRLGVLLQLVYISTSLASEPCFTIGLFLKNYDEALLVRDIFYAAIASFSSCRSRYYLRSLCHLPSMVKSFASNRRGFTNYVRQVQVF